MDFNINEYVWHIDQLHHINGFTICSSVWLWDTSSALEQAWSMDASWCIIERIFSTDTPASLVSLIITRLTIFTVMSSENFWSAVNLSTSRYTGAWIQEDNVSEITSLPFKRACYGDYTFLKSSIVLRLGNWDSFRNGDPLIHLSKTFW